VVGDLLTVEADIFCDGHDQIAAALLYRPERGRDWREAPMRLVDNDRWRGEFILAENTRYLYTIIAWRDLFATWRDEVVKKRAAGLPISLELIEGRLLMEKAASEGSGGSADDRRELDELLQELRHAPSEMAQLELLTHSRAVELLAGTGPRTNLTRYDKDLEVWVDRRAAEFSAWYEMMPRSQSGDPTRHGTFDDVIGRLSYVGDLGFDVLYLTPIHPIGRINRKGRNNTLEAVPGEPGSPYAIGSSEGGHDAVHPELGSFADFERLLAAAREHGIEIALDFAIQCAPDHPWVKEHPEWFDWRPDGSIKFAENPPKKYQDIVNVHFYRDAFPTIWFALRDLVLFWVEKGVRIFRVDNPHTKPTPDINPYYLQTSGRPGFQVRLVLAATLAGNYGIYNGFELCESRAFPGKEEYLDSEKYELKAWDWDRPDHIREDVRRINRLRRAHPALQQFTNVTFYNAWNDHILYYGKAAPDRGDFLLFAVNLDPHNAHGAHFEVPLWEFGLPDDASIDAVDLVLEKRFTWTGKVQHMWLDPRERPYMIWQLIAPQTDR
jgi:hypothetical protein